MISFDLGQRPRGVLAIGAHPDDVEIGCGGTLLQLASRWPGLPVSVVVMTGTEQRREEARVATELFLAGCEVDLRTHSLPDGALPAVWGQVKTSLEEFAAEADEVGRRFDLVLAPRPDDAHQDHRLIAGLVPTVWRDHLVLGYEIPKYDGDLGRPNLYLPLPDEVAVAKVRLLEKAFGSQVGRDWWDEEMFLGLARLRGMECRSRYAEAFSLTKATWSW
jgi:LmbE family N-acetylglucosaminyl deacetylase